MIQCRKCSQGVVVVGAYIRKEDRSAFTVTCSCCRGDWQSCSNCATAWKEKHSIVKNVSRGENNG